MRTIEEVVADRKITADEFRVLNKFWVTIRVIQSRRDAGASKNRSLVGAALGTRRISGREIDIETLVSLTGLGRSSLQKTLSQMTADGMVNILRDEKDKRRILVKPTEKFLSQSLDMYEDTKDLIMLTCREIERLRSEI